MYLQAAEVAKVRKPTCPEEKLQSLMVVLVVVVEAAGCAVNVIWQPTTSAVR